MTCRVLLITCTVYFVIRAVVFDDVCGSLTYMYIVFGNMYSSLNNMYDVFTSTVVCIDMYNSFNRMYRVFGDMYASCWGNVQ